MKPQSLFFLFSFFSFLGGLFVYVFVKETKGLTDLEKKQLYKPVSISKVTP